MAGHRSVGVAQGLLPGHLGWVWDGVYVDQRGLVAVHAPGESGLGSHWHSFQWDPRDLGALYTEAGGDGGSSQGRVFLLTFMAFSGIGRAVLSQVGPGFEEWPGMFFGSWPVSWPMQVAGARVEVGRGKKPFDLDGVGLLLSAPQRAYRLRA